MLFRSHVGVNVGMTSSLGAQPAGNAGVDTRPAAGSGTFRVGGDLPVHRLGFGAMRLTGKGIWGEPRDAREAIAVLRRAVELGVNLIDTADSYGPEVSERLIAEALYPYPQGLVIATKAGFERPGPDQWKTNGQPEHLRAACDGSLRTPRGGVERRATAACAGSSSSASTSISCTASILECPSPTNLARLGGFRKRGRSATWACRRSR